MTKSIYLEMNVQTFTKKCILTSRLYNSVYFIAAQMG